LTNDTTPVNLIPAPAASTQRIIDYISVYNNDTAAVAPTVKFNDNGTTYALWTGSMGAGSTLRFLEGVGWTYESEYRSLKSFSVHSDAGVNWTLTNATLAERFAGNTSRNIFSVDLEGYSQVRLRANLMVGSVSVNTPRLLVKYSPSYSTAHTSYLTLGDSGDGEVSISLTGAGYEDTGWTNIVEGAKQDNAFICFKEIGGNGTADPAFGLTYILFR
jgi:hypothetical protein